VFAFLVTHVLGETPEHVGRAQSALVAPGLLLIPIGGLVADRLDALRLLPPLHLTGVLPILGVAAALATDSLGYPLLVVHALGMGSLGAFLGPARDALLTRVAEGAIQRTVTFLLLVTWTGQLVGFLLAAADASRARAAALPALRGRSVAVGQ